MEEPEQAAEIVSDRVGPDTEAEKNEAAAAVRHAVEQLPDNIRIVVVMRHYQDLKFREIAEILEIPEGTIKTRMMQGLSLLAKQLTPAGSSTAQAKQLKPIPTPLSYETSH